MHGQQNIKKKIIACLDIWEHCTGLLKRCRTCDSMCSRPYRGSGGQSPACHRGGQIRPQASSCDISGGRSVTGIVPLPFPPPGPVPRFPPVSIIPPILRTCLHYQKDERVKNLEKTEAVRFRISGRV